MAAHQLTSPRYAISGVPVFMYHDVCKDSTPEERYTLPLFTFRQHLAYLREQGITVADLCSLASCETARSVVLTFDDGLQSHYENVYPALLECGLRATFFATTSLIDTPGFLSWKQVREMSDAGMSFGSHGNYHINYCDLSASETQCQFRCSRVALEDALGKPVTSFSAPFGFTNRTVVGAATKAGFQQICSSKPWLASPDDAVIPRLAIYRNTGVTGFSALVGRSAFPLLTRITRDAFLYFPKQLASRICPGRLRLHVNEETR